MKNNIFIFGAITLFSLPFVSAQIQTENLNMSTYELQFPSVSGGNNRIQSGGSLSGSWLFKSRFDNLIFNAGENSSHRRKIVFETGDIDRMSLGASGKLYIATEDDSASGYYKTQGGVMIKRNLGSPTSEFWKNKSHLELRNHDNEGGNIVLSMHRAGHSNAAIIHPNNGGLLFVPEGNSSDINRRVYITPSANVGIGIANPEAKLHVQDGDVKIRFNNSYNHGPLLTFKDAAADGADIEQAFYRFSGTNNNYYSTRFLRQAGSGFKIQMANSTPLGNHNFVDALTIGNNGNMGIGSSASPLSNKILNIESAEGKVKLKSTDNTKWTEYEAMNSNGDYTVFGTAPQGTGLVGTNSPKNFVIRTGATTRMHFDHGKENVGIGTSNPNSDSQLHVNGQIRSDQSYVLTGVGKFDKTSNNDLKIWTNNKMFFAAGGKGNTRMMINNNGDVGIGTGSATPSGKLHIKGQRTILDRDGVYGHYIDFYRNGAQKWRVNGGVGSDDDAFAIIKGINEVLFSIDYESGSVGIGTNTPDANSALSVEGKIHAREVLVDTNIFADYVFADSYNLKPLEEVEAYIKANKHLEGFKSEKEVVKDGIELKELSIKQQEKIEELTLYTIEQEKKIETLEARLKAIEALLGIIPLSV